MAAYTDQLYSEEPLAIRQATEDDLEGILWIVKNAFPDDPGCDYKFPYRDDHPKDFLKWTKKEYKEYLEQPEKFAFLLITAPVKQDEKVIDKPIALAVWDIATETKSTGGDRGIHERKDVNVAHVHAYNAAMSRGFEKHFRKYHQKQLHLWMLMTHPDYRRRGAGTMLCNWGLREATRRGDWPLTLMSSPMGEALYKHLGYELVGKETVQVEGETEKVPIGVMEKLISK